MGTVIRFPLQRHARASWNSGSLRAAKRAKTSKVTQEFARSPAKRTMPGQWGLGMPLDLHPLTVLPDCVSAPATSPVPPHASIISSQVGSMTEHIVRKLRTCQPLAICETTIRGRNVPIMDMDTDRDVARRLIAVREHFKCSQVDFANSLHIAKNTLNGFEMAKRPLTIETAKRIRKRFGVSVDWLLFGDVGQPSHDLVLELGPAPTVQKENAPAASSDKRKTSRRLRT